MTVGAVLVLLALLVWSLVRSSDGARFVKRTEQGKKPPAPGFVLPVIWKHDQTWPESLRPRLGDDRLDLREMRGHVVVINFWASWCVPCKEEAPAFAEIATHYQGKVAFVGIDVQDLKSAARHFLNRYKVNYVSVRDGTDKTYTAYGLTGVPETYFIDERGRTIEHAVGGLAKNELRGMVDVLLEATTR